MRTVLVASSKGGVGKTTVATHLAARAALAGLRTALVDADPQGSARRWAERRADSAGGIVCFDGSGKRWRPQRLAGMQQVVIDAPAGAMAADLARFLDAVDAIVVPVQPSALDIEATVPFLNSISTLPRVRAGRLPVGLVGNRLKPWTTVSQQALALLRRWPYPLVAQLRDCQAYVLATGLGKSLFDYGSRQVREHQRDWQPLLQWSKWLER